MNYTDGMEHGASEEQKSGHVAEERRRRARGGRARGEGGWACTNTPSVSPTTLVDAASSPLQRFTEVTFLEFQWLSNLKRSP